MLIIMLHLVELTQQDSVFPRRAHDAQLEGEILTFAYRYGEVPRTGRRRL